MTTDVVGIVLAEGFVGIPETPPNISLVQFRLSGSEWPFRIVQPNETSLELRAEPGPSRGKTSGLNSFAEHRDYITESEELRSAFTQISRCFIESSDNRSEWVFQNVKGEHLAVHYKGEYLSDIWAKRKRFYVGYLMDKQRVWRSVETSNLAETMAKVQVDFQRLLLEIDKRVSGVIPKEFNWRAAQ